METKEKLLKIISDSNLESQDKEIWEKFFDVSPEEALSVYVDVLTSFPEELDWFNRIMKRKISAMTMIQNGDEKGEAEMKNIIEEERVKFEELSQKM